MINHYPSPLTLKGLTTAAQQKVNRAGYLDITSLKLADIADKRNYCPKQLDFKNVFALVNFNGPEPYRTAVITLDNHIFAVRSTANRLLNKLGQTFVLDRDHLRRDICPALGINKQVPYVCGDYWLIPMDEINGNNTSWIRWMNQELDVAYEDEYLNIGCWRSVPQRWSMTRLRLRRRLKKCLLVAEFIEAIVAQIVPPGKPQELIDVQPVVETITQNHIAQLTEKYGRQDDIVPVAGLCGIL